MDKFRVPDPFDTPYDLEYVELRIKTLGDVNSRAEWATSLDQIRKCANPPMGVNVTAEARRLAKIQMKELAARNRRGRM